LAVASRKFHLVPMQHQEWQPAYLYYHPIVWVRR
jgi:hypothetical protein